MPPGYTETIPLGGWKTPLPEPDPAYRSVDYGRPDYGVWPWGAVVFLFVCLATWTVVEVLGRVSR
jgi:hypothetical protein